MPRTLPLSPRRATVIAMSIVAAGTGLSACGGSSSGGTPASGSHGSTLNPNGSRTFKQVSAKDATKLEASLPTAAGVRTVTYYKKTKKLQVFFHGATASDKQAAINLVTQR